MKKIFLTIGLICIGVSYSNNTAKQPTEIEETLIKFNTKIDEAIDVINADTVNFNGLRYTQK